MKKLLFPVLLIPSVAMAGMVLVDDGSTATQTTGVAASPIVAGPPAVTGSPANGTPVTSPVTANAVLDAGIVPLWTAPAGSTLKDSIQKWATQSNWTLVWDAPDGVDKFVNYRVVAALHFQGSIDQAVAECIKLYEHAKKPLALDVNPSQRLLYVHLKYS
ncbi:TcpQ domain-containing protein [Paraburkholderia fungorum]|uniref:TcpQ domain-containing protein n=1 Tax=Paraburkholderia fungorum TaxID=134537 RepID=UPI00402BCC11